MTFKVEIEGNDKERLKRFYNGLSGKIEATPHLALVGRSCNLSDLF